MSCVCCGSADDAGGQLPVKQPADWRWMANAEWMAGDEGGESRGQAWSANDGASARCGGSGNSSDGLQASKGQHQHQTSDAAQSAKCPRVRADSLQRLENWLDNHNGSAVLADTAYTAVRKCLGRGRNCHGRKGPRSTTADSVNSFYAVTAVEIGEKYVSKCLVDAHESTLISGDIHKGTLGYITAGDSCELQ